MKIYKILLSSCLPERIFIKFRAQNNYVHRLQSLETAVSIFSLRDSHFRAFYDFVCFSGTLSFLLSGCFVKKRPPCNEKVWLVTDSLRLFASVMRSDRISWSWEFCIGTAGQARNKGEALGEFIHTEIFKNCTGWVRNQVLVLG